MIEKCFVDSNVWLYLLLGDDIEKYHTVRNFIDEKTFKGKIVVSWQVINEVTSNLIKRKFPENQIAIIIEWICKIAHIENFTEDMLLQASELRQRLMVSFWDSLIISAALSSGCKTLVSEDMQDGQKIDSLFIKNIFL